MMRRAQSNGIDSALKYSREWECLRNYIAVTNNKIVAIIRRIDN